MYREGVAGIVKGRGIGGVVIIAALFALRRTMCVQTLTGGGPTLNGDLIVGERSCENVVPVPADQDAQI